MSASAPDASGAHHHAAGFSSRAAAVFGALSAPSAQPAWALSEETVFRAGKAADYSSDEEVQAAVAEKWREETLPSDLLDLSGEGAAAAVKPSAAFCQALDNEDEFDEVDELAAGRSRSGEGEPMPHLSTEVLEDNAYERQSHAQSASEAMEVERPGDAQPAAELEQAPAHAAAHEAKLGAERTAARRAGPTAPGAHVPEAAGEDEEEAARSKARKRVRFQDDVAAAAPSERGGPDGGAAAATRRRPQRSARGSYVPDHVRNPGKYTCYALDEPLIIGSGGGGGDALDDAEQVRAARAAQAAAQATLAPPDAEGNEASEGALPADLPAFGKGIAFVPRSRRGTANGSAIGEAAASGRAGSGAEGSTEGGTEGRARGGAAGAVGVDRLGVGQGAMALDEGLAGEDGAEEAAMDLEAAAADPAPAPAARRRVFRGHKPALSNSGGSS